MKLYIKLNIILSQVEEAIAELQAYQAKQIYPAKQAAKHSGAT